VVVATLSRRHPSEAAVPARGPNEPGVPVGDLAFMRLSDIERDKLLLTVAAELAWRRRKRGLRLNYPETVAILSCYVLEGARDGRSVAELMDGGRSVLKRSEVMDGIPEMLSEVQMEATFPDGTKLVTIHEPLR